MLVDSEKWKRSLSCMNSVDRETLAVWNLQRLLPQMCLLEVKRQGEVMQRQALGFCFNC